MVQSNISRPSISSIENTLRIFLFITFQPSFLHKFFLHLFYHQEFPIFIYIIFIVNYLIISIFIYIKVFNILFITLIIHYFNFLSLEFFFSYKNFKISVGSLFLFVAYNWTANWIACDDISDTNSIKNWHSFPFRISRSISHKSRERFLIKCLSKFT